MVKAWQLVLTKLMMEEIRQSLYADGNLKEIQLDFPIVFMHNIDLSIFYEHNKNYCGFCDVLYSDWIVSDADDSVKISSNFKVERIVIRIYD